MPLCVVYTSDKCLKGCPGRRDGCLLSNNAQTGGKPPKGYPIEEKEEPKTDRGSKERR